MDKNINIEDIMNEIRTEIKEKGLTADMLDFDDIPVNSIEQKNTNDVSIKRLVKKVIRKLYMIIN